MNIIVPYVVIQAYSIIIPIAKWDVFDNLPYGPQGWFSDETGTLKNNDITF